MRGVSVRNKAKVKGGGGRRRRGSGAWFPWWIEIPLIILIGRLLVWRYAP